MYKNRANQKFGVRAWNSDGTPATGEAANITAQIVKDGGTSAATNDTNPTEIDATNQKGLYVFDATQAETNADLINFTAVCSTSGVTLDPVEIYTVEAPPSVAGGAAINEVAGSFTLNDGTVQSGSYTDTATVNQVYHEIDDDSGTLDVYYEFDIGSTGVPTGGLFTGRMNGINDNVPIVAWDWDSSAWDQLAVIVGVVGATDSEVPFTLIGSKHVGTGANKGKVRIGFRQLTGLTSSTLYVDQIYVSYAVVASTVGYANGAVWYDDSAGNTGTTPDVDGVADNPVSSWTSVLSLLAAKNLKRVQIAGGSALTLTSDMTKHELIGLGRWTLNLNGQTIDSAFFKGADVQGIGVITAPGKEAHFTDCDIGQDAACTVGESYFTACGFGDYPITFATAGKYQMNRCHSNVAGTDQPEIIMTPSEEIELGVRDYPGSMRFKTLDSGHTISFDAPGGRVIADTTCTGGLIKSTWPTVPVDESEGRVTFINLRAGAMHTGTLRNVLGNGKNIIQLAADAPNVESGMDPCQIYLSKGIIHMAGTGIEYDTTNKTLVLRESLKVQVDDTWQYEILPSASRETVNNGLLQGGTKDAPQLNAKANQQTDAYKYQVLRITASPNVPTIEDFATVIAGSSLIGGKVVLSLETDLPADPNGETSYEISMDQAIPYSTLTLLMKYARNKKVRKMDAGKQYLVIYDDDGTTEILRKYLTDKDANDLDLATGILAVENASSV